ncbi:MAG: hypothetical protein Q8L81_06550 [Bacteroidota bacterium]|nr:hypothetical protein [Bacteroidota bacterium]
MSKTWVSFIYILLLASCDYKKPWICIDDCENGSGTKIWKDGGLEVGEWKNGNQHGKGKQVFGRSSEFFGDMYEGEFKDGVYEGTGFYYDKSRDGHYKGEWKNGQPNGQGRSFSGPKHEHPGMTYEGQWKNNLYDGKGILYWGEKGEFAHDKYVGEWKNGKMDGFGKYYWANGNVYEGSWQKDKQHGEGIYIIKDGDTLKGHFENGQYKK